MRRALKLAARGRGRVSPNPMVGAVVVKRGRLVGEGWHRVHGGPHAEIEALADAGARARGATLYVTLEPCAHTGRTPPCTGAILEAGVGRVVAAMKDPNPHVTGGGCRRLARRGIAVTTGLLQAESMALNAGFVHWARTGRPLVTLKIASSIDGGIATETGDSKWITGPAARREAHRLRAEHDAVVVGAATVEADDPGLTVRHIKGENPARIVFDPELRTSTAARWLSADGARRIVVASASASPRRTKAFKETGAEIWIVPGDAKSGIGIEPFVARAAAGGFLSLMVEGGGRLAGAFLAAGCVDRVRIFTAPVFLGGAARGWTRSLIVNEVKDAPRLTNVRVRRFGDDWQVEGDLNA